MQGADWLGEGVGESFFDVMGLFGLGEGGGFGLVFFFGGGR